MIQRLEIDIPAREGLEQPLQTSIRRQSPPFQAGPPGTMYHQSGPLFGRAISVRRSVAAALLKPRPDAITEPATDHGVPNNSCKAWIPTLAPDWLHVQNQQVCLACKQRCYCV